MKDWIVKYRWKKDQKKKFPKDCKNCGNKFLSNGPTEHCSMKCFLHLRKNVDKRGCWIWSGSLTNKGYAKTSNSKLVHRISYQEFKGDIPEGIFVCHVCDVPACFNPEHLFLGTQKENMQDSLKKGRTTRFPGSRNPMARLNEFDVINIRQMIKNKVKTKLILEKFGISRPNLSLIKNNKRWSHLST